MTKRIFLSLLLFLLIPSCVPAAPTTAPAPTAESSPEIWWSNAVFYEIFVRSFNDSDGNGIGDFNGITQKLDYLEDLGITAVWLMPIFPSPSYHGYDVTDYYDVNPQYGTMDDFKNLWQKLTNATSASSLIWSSITHQINIPGSRKQKRPRLTLS
ncbi:MAG: hypothetical protein IPN58_01140 [Anaerolineales bacterium]|nr:hypothetical protein [Anaerolineales bacterium]